MAWRRLLALQEVEATVDGVRRRLLAAEWDDRTDAIKVVWPPDAPGAFASMSRRVVEAGDYEPVDHYGFPGDLF